MSKQKWLPVIRAYPLRCTTEKPYRDGGRFTLVKGAKWFSAKGLDFGTESIKDKRYRTWFGPSFAHSGESYKVDDVGLRGAVTRLTCAREPDRIGLHEELRSNQFENYGVGEVYSVFQEFVSNGIDELTPDFDHDRQRDCWTDTPHPKKSLRVRTRAEMDASGAFAEDLWLGNHGRVKYVCKPDEMLPQGKYLRATGDLGPRGTAQGAYMMDVVKEAFSREFKYRNCSYQFVKKPEREELIRAFQAVWDGEDDVCLRCFSDDAIIGVDMPDGRYVANTDISACDGSNYDPVFLFLKQIMLGGNLNQKDVRGVFLQCRADCVIESYSDKEFKRKPRKVVLRPKYDTLYSGSVLTTSINNCANFGIFASVIDNLPPFHLRTVETVSAAIAAAAARVGYILKCQVCTSIEDLQFLKCSPTYVGGLMEVFVNIGVLLRNLGSTVGDLPGKGEIRERAQQYTSDVIRSYVHAGEHELTQALRSKIVESTLGVEEKPRLTGPVRCDIPLSCIARRYGVSEFDLLGLCWQIRSSEIGEVLSSPLLDRIYEVDYGYSPLLSSRSPVRHVEQPLCASNPVLLQWHPPASV